MSAPVANTRTNPDKVIVDDVTLPGCAGRLGPTVSGTVEPTGTMAPGTALFAYQAIEGHQDTVARGARSTVLRMKNARVDDKPFTTNDHDAKKRPIRPWHHRPHQRRQDVQRGRGEVPDRSEARPVNAFVGLYLI
mgnify:CR=1 FL=1